MTNYNRLILEMNGKQYFSAEGYMTFLEEAGLDPDSTFSATNDLLKLKKCALSVLRALANDTSQFLKIETEFTTVSAGYQYLSKRIADLKEEIEDLKEEARTNTASNSAGLTSFLFYDKLDEDDD